MGIFRILAASLLIFLAAPALAETDAGEGPNVLDEHDFTTDAGQPVAVMPPAHPTHVAVGLTLLRITKIDPPSEIFPKAEVEAFLEMDWQDPRLAFDPAVSGMAEQTFLEHDAALRLEEIWWPDAVIQNEVHKREQENVELVITSKGEVRYKERFLATIPLKFDLAHYPFDSQILRMDLESFAWDDRELDLQPVSERVGVGKDVAAPGWTITGVSADVVDTHEARGDNGFSELRLLITMDRDYWYNLKTTIIPLAIILLVLCLVIFARIEGRVEYILIALLAFVAFNSLIAEEMPGLSDFIFLDFLILFGYVASLLALFEAVVVQRLLAAGRVEIAQRLEHVTQIGMPALVALVLVSSIVFVMAA